MSPEARPITFTNSSGGYTYKCRNYYLFIYIDGGMNSCITWTYKLIDLGLTIGFIIEVRVIIIIQQKIIKDSFWN